LTRTAVTYGQLDRALHSLGFTSRLINLQGEARDYEHKNSGAQIILPSYLESDKVQEYHLSMVQATLEECGISDPADFAAKLDEASKTGPGFVEPRTDFLECGQIRISSKLVAELDGRGRPLIRVPLSSEVELSLHFGFRIFPTVIAAGCGFPLFAIGLLEILALLCFGEGDTNWWPVVTMIPLLLLQAYFGIWILCQGCKRGFYLTVKARRLNVNLDFRKGVTRTKIEQFLQKVELQYGLVVVR